MGLEPPHWEETYNKPIRCETLTWWVQVQCPHNNCLTQSGLDLGRSPEVETQSGLDLGQSPEAVAQSGLDLGQSLEAMAQSSLDVGQSPEVGLSLRVGWD